MANICVVGKLPEKVYIEDVNGYRGVDRDGIRYPFEYYETGHRIMEINARYEELTDRDFYLHDLGFARTLRDVFDEAYPDDEREILEVCYGNVDSELGGKFLGFDITDRGNSNILRIILTNSKDDYQESHSQFTKVLTLITKSILSRLNESQLFSTYEDAVLALDLIEGTFKIFGKTSRHHHFEVVKVFLVV